ncbi:MAG: glycogen debranching protein GlgX [Lautropia sp.]|nr:glycogen debranching protein GlgX [Lautropia sp.]
MSSPQESSEASPPRRADTVLETGSPYPLGANCTAGGVNFAVFSEHATRMVVCVFDAHGSRELARHDLPEHTDGVWHGHLPGAGAGLVYGYRAWGPVDHHRGLRFNPNKLLLDPYARSVAGEFRWTDAHLDTPEQAAADNVRDIFKSVVTLRDQDRCAPDADVGSPRFDWDGDRPPAVPLDESVLYEVHVKGFTRLHPEVPQALRGTYEGFCSPAAIAHLKRLGVTAVSLLPVHQSVSEQPLSLKGLVNYWGYSTIGFFAPDRRFAREDPVREFKTMVRELHRAGIEVLLDVVYNHTAEGDQRGPTLSMRGLDNRSYYHLRHGVQSHYENYTGTGNSLDLSHPRVLQMVMDSLRYWVTEMHVDGFRFDLAPTLGRYGDRAHGDAGAFDRDAAFFQAVRQDPVLARVKLIAEPWDAASGGYQVGQFPAGWSEWNDRYRDAVRGFWLSKISYRGDMARRLEGSPDLFRYAGRRPQASVNFVAAHDGFTLQDLVSYSHKHNEANGEENRDGSSENRSWNCGHEGPTDLLMVLATRARLKRALLASLLLSQGVPMLLGGDELGRTQRGNNNAYNQDNEISWFDWRSAEGGLIDFTAWVISLRRQYPQLRSRHWLDHRGPVAGEPAAAEATWMNRLGAQMTAAEWEENGRYVFGLKLCAREPDQVDLLLLFNAQAGDVIFHLPAGHWQLVLDTGQRDGRPEDPARAGETLLLKARSLTLLQQA